MGFTRFNKMVWQQAGYQLFCRMPLAPASYVVPYAAVVLDLDGVITATRHLHVRAWKRAFDELLIPRGERAFDPVSEYASYVDGKPRDDGIRSFLGSRGIALSADQVASLGERKTGYYLGLLASEGPRVFPDAEQALRIWQERGIPLAIVSSSRSCARVLRLSGLADAFEARVDGVVGARLGLAGKPAPDYFLEAARRLRVEPSRTCLVEDALAGVEAGRRGRFGTVIGVDRSGRFREELIRHGAERVVSSLLELVPAEWGAGVAPASKPDACPKRAP